ncbi:hypothetical protein [Rhodococcus sp. BE178]|uniref:hypothetical protein n=1 Tax=Rhodococcus sp. BE178 TaxID=2817737 RepID=UPI003D1D7CAD
MTAPALNLVERSDVEARLGETLAEPEIAQVDSLIEYASDKLRALVEDIDERIASGALRFGLVRGTLVTAICRALDTLRIGIRVRSEQYPEISTTYADSDASLVYFTDDELEPLQPSGAGDGGAFSIRLG